MASGRNSDVAATEFILALRGKWDFCGQDADKLKTELNYVAVDAKNKKQNKTKTK